MEQIKRIFTKRNIFIAGGIVFFLFISYLFLPIFHVKHFVILGNSAIKQEDISKYTQENLNRNIYLLRKKKIQEDFLENPYIKKIEIKPKFPRTLVLYITGRKPVATVKFSGGFAIIDDSGTVLETTQDIMKIVKPMISGIEPKDITIGEQIKSDNNWRLGISIVSNVKSAKLLNNISLIDISKVHDIHLITPQGIHVLLGEGKDLNEKMLVLNKILINLFERKIYSGYVDMRYDSYPVYRSKK